MSNTVNLTIHGEPASKSNSRKIVMFGKRPAIIKSQKARDYVESVAAQCQAMDLPNDLLEGDVWIEITIFYRTRRPDLDESVILDCLQGVVYSNDRQVKEKHVFHALDKENPSAEICVGEINNQKNNKSQSKRLGKC